MIIQIQNWRNQHPLMIRMVSMSLRTAMRKKEEHSGVSYDGLERLMEALEVDILSEFDPAQVTRVIRHLILCNG